MVHLGPRGAKGEPGYQKPTWSPNCPLPHFSFSRGPWDMLRAVERRSAMDAGEFAQGGPGASGVGVCVQGRQSPQPLSTMREWGQSPTVTIHLRLCAKYCKCFVIWFLLYRRPAQDGSPVPALLTLCRAFSPSSGLSPRLVDHMVLGAPVSGSWLRAAKPHVLL